jgi:deazaflavin-dependent oxidoreductase (nitroreductase family)
MSDYNQKIIEEFRASRDKGETPLEGRPLVLLTTTGAKTGRQHTTPVRPFYDGDRLYIIASKGGHPSDPDWFRNLTANPEVTVEAAGETFDAYAVVVTGDERERLWKAAVEVAPMFGDYEAKTTRQIPVVVLERQ